jgi:hypothetical protein
VTTAETRRWPATCPNCGTASTGPWCAGCGQELATGPRTLVRATRRQWGRVRHSIVALVAHPGQLTAEFRDGRRARSISPWRLAFNVVTIFLVLSFVTNFRVSNFPKLDPTGTLATAISVAAQKANVDQVTFTERLDRRFNTIYTLLVVLPITVAAIVAWLTHRRRREPWSVHFAFALHLVAWTFILNLIYLMAMRIFGGSNFMIADEATTPIMSVALLALILSWQYAYMLVAFRRVYADGWIGSGAKAALLLCVALIADNAVLFLSIWLALKTLAPTS